MTSEERQIYNHIQTVLGTAVEKKRLGDVDIVKLDDVDEFCSLGKGHELYFQTLVEPYSEEEYYATFEYKPVNFEDLPIVPECTKESILRITPLIDGTWKGKTVEETVEELIDWYYKEWYPKEVWDDVRRECSRYADEKLTEINNTIAAINSSLPWNAKPWRTNKDDDEIILRLFFIDDNTAYTLKLGKLTDPQTEDGIKYLMGMYDREEYARDKVFLVQQDICFHVRDFVGELACGKNDEEYGKAYLENTKNGIKNAIEEKNYYNLSGKALNVAVDDLYSQFNPSASRGKYYVTKSDIKKLIQ